MPSTRPLFDRRRRRNRTAIRQRLGGKPRLSVHRTSKHIYAQVIDDSKGITLSAASSLDKTVKGSGAVGSNCAAATSVGTLLAERALKTGVKKVVFDRGGFIYHGRVKALAEAARAAGLEF